MNDNSKKYYQLMPESCSINSKTIALIISLLFCSYSAITQESKYNFKDIDATTYQLYMQKDWDSLIKTGNEAIKQGEDYFYLRLRVGIAYYYKGNYRKATSHLQKALQFNDSDATALELLYYCYKFTKRDLEARALLSKFSESLREITNTKKLKVLEQVYIETGPTFSNNIDNNKRGNLIGRDSIYGEQDLNDDKYYFQIGLGLNPLKRVSMYAGYSYLSISKFKQIQTGEEFKYGSILIPWGNNGYAVGNAYKMKIDSYGSDYKLYQNQGYLNASIYAGRGFIITPAFHFIFAKYSTIQAKAEVTEYYHQPIDPDPSIKTTFNVSELDTSYYNYVVSLAINKNICLFDFGLFGTYSNLNNFDQYQAGATIGYYPKGNLDVYSLTNFVLAWEDGDTRYGFEELIGVKAMKKLWVEGSVFFGEMVNYNEKNAYVVYNSGDKMKLRAGLNIIVPLSDKFEISARYQYFINEGSWFRLDENYEPQIFSTEYQNHTIIGGLAWKL